jgi:hypothetical protein
LSAQQAEDLISSAKASLFVTSNEYRCFVDNTTARKTIQAAQGAYGNEGKMALQAWTAAIKRLQTMQTDSTRVTYLCCDENGLRFPTSQVLAPNFTRSLSTCMQQV